MVKTTLHSQNGIFLVSVLLDLGLGGRLGEGMSVECKSECEEDWKEPVGRVSSEDEWHVVGSKLSPYLFDENDSEGVEEGARGGEDGNANPLQTHHHRVDGNQIQRRVNEGRYEAHSFEPQWIGTQKGVCYLAPPHDVLPREKEPKLANVRSLSTIECHQSIKNSR